MTHKTKDRKIRVMISIDPDIYSKAKVSCNKTGRKLSSLIQVLLENELKKSA